MWMMFLKSIKLELAYKIFVSSAKLYALKFYYHGQVIYL